VPEPPKDAYGQGANVVRALRRSLIQPARGIVWFQIGKTPVHNSVSMRAFDILKNVTSPVPDWSKRLAKLCDVRSAKS
jgi:hypothetical protein